MSIDLTDAQREEVRRILRTVLVPKDEAESSQAWVFGSRATGRARPYSDLDILISTPTPLGWRERADLADAFESSNLPFRVDIVEASRLAGGMTARIAAEKKPLF